MLEALQVHAMDATALSRLSRVLAACPAALGLHFTPLRRLPGAEWQVIG